MRGLFQLAIVALLLNAGYQAASSYYAYYDFKSRLLEEVHHGRVNTTSELRQRTVDVAASYGLDVALDDVSVSIADTGETVVDFAYVQNVAFVPKYYSRPWAYRGSVSALRARPLKVDYR